MTNRYEILLTAIQSRNDATLVIAALALGYLLAFWLARPAPRIQNVIVFAALLTWFGLLITLGV